MADIVPSKRNAIRQAEYGYREKAFEEAVRTGEIEVLHSFDDEETGFKAQIHRNLDGTISGVISGTDKSDPFGFLNDLESGISLMANKKVRQFETPAYHNYVEKVVEIEQAGTSVNQFGHSLGGTGVTLARADIDKKHAEAGTRKPAGGRVVTLNAPGARETLAAHGHDPDAVAKNNKITNIRTGKRDFVTNINTPVGKTETLPDAARKTVIKTGWGDYNVSIPEFSHPINAAKKIRTRPVQ